MLVVFVTVFVLVHPLVRHASADQEQELVVVLCAAYSGRDDQLSARR